MKRCIMLFPSFDNIELINDMREKYDPLYSLVCPHITLVFPFDSEITSDRLEDHIKSAVKEINPFPISLKNFTVKEADSHNYLFLNVQKGNKEIRELSRKLYSGILEEFKHKEYEDLYCPHITVGKLEKHEDINQVIFQIQQCTQSFTSIIKNISVEIIGDDESSTIEMEIEL